MGSVIPSAVQLVHCCGGLKTLLINRRDTIKPWESQTKSKAHGLISSPRCTELMNRTQ